MTFFPIPLTVFQAAFRSHPAFPLPSPSGHATLLAPGVFTARHFQSQTLSQLPTHRELRPGSPHAWSHVKVPAGSHGPATRPPQPSCPDRQRRKGRKVRNSRGNTKVRKGGGGAPWCQIRYCLQPVLEQRKCEREGAAERNWCVLIIPTHPHALPLYCSGWVEESRGKLNMGKGGRNVLFYCSSCFSLPESILIINKLN